MSTFDDLSLSAGEFSGKVRLFPLPNLVLFPHVMQPLHVFEPRYRDLLEDALAWDRLIAMAVLTPGWERNYEGRPPIYSMACLGRITTHCRLTDGTYNVLLLGIQRVRLLREIKPSRLFREAEAELCEDHYRRCGPTRQQALRRRLHGALLRVLPKLPEAQEQLDQLLGNDIPLGVLADVISHVVAIGLARKQALLSEVDVFRRIELLLADLCAATSVDEAKQQAAHFDFSPAFSAN